MGKKGKKTGKHKKKSFQQEVLDTFRKYPKKQFNYKQVASKMNVNDPGGKNKIRDILNKLDSNEDIEEVRRGKFRLIPGTSTTEGIVDINRNGSAYVIVDDFEEDVFISPKHMRTALHGDRVKISMFAHRRGKKQQGEILEVLKRAKTTFAGMVEVVGKFAFLVPDSQKMHVDLYIPLNKLKGAKHGQKAIAKMTDWPRDASSPFGEVTEVLGTPGEREVEMSSILTEYGFPLKFPENVEKEAANLPIEITDKEIAKRRDFRNVDTFTIDPVDAKDFDDAISVQKLKNGNYEIGVHIADVTHYVQPGGAIDQVAVDRATSVYLVDRVVPMLPEVLSNNVCSLRPNEDKLCFSCVFEIDENANVKNNWIGRTVIHSNKRFHYEEVQEILEGKDGPYKDELKHINSLAKILRKNRMKAGAIAFDKIEVRFELDDEKLPVGVKLKIQKDAHKLIEEFMLLANRNVAEKIGRVTQKGQQLKTFVYRIHDTPDQEKLADFAAFIKKFGYQFHAPKTGDIAASMNALLAEVKGKREENVVETLAIRTMAKAVYATDNIGHYGLAFDHYTHFTSPIRRYPDVMVHRLLQRYLDGGKSADQDHYDHLCKHSSEMEKKASDAERDSVKYYQMLFMQGSEGKEFKGFVSGVTEWGLFVEIEENKCEGMIRLRDIDDDFYFFDDANFRIIGHNTGRIINFGDELTVRVKRVDLIRRQMDFELVEN